MRFGLKEKTIAQIHSVLAHHPQVQKAILYGSRAKGNYKTGSDIDLSIFNGTSDPDVIDHIQRVGVTFYARPNGYDTGPSPNTGVVQVA
ncbi:MAG: nucleotidyltransferase domain-containing protein [Chloroflexi bacterium]|nr:nucleotidyltransferase domain-containing protein [Chloroflexota bacterium]